MNFVFLYTEIAEYFLACCRELSQHGNIHIVRWPLNKEAPFQFQFNEKIKVYEKNNYTQHQLSELIQSINPSIIICSGWIDKEYLKITKQYYKKIPTVMTCDTHWRGDLKQYAATIISKFTLLKTFTHAWVPGQIQKQYVLNLGFKEANIQTKFYSCDLPHFENLYQQQKNQKEKNFPKRFIYVGRYYDFKGITELWQAFIELQTEQPNEWELWCLGVGDIKPVEHKQIKHFGFVQPKDLAHYTSQTGVFILPSRYEPWGVVVHEFAASGFPLLVSNKVGANEQFLINGKNGFTFESNNAASIKLAMQKIISSPNSSLIQMGKASNEISKKISPTIWVNNLLSMLN